MTSDANATVVEPSEDTPKASEEWAKHTFVGREITLLRPTPEQLMVLRRLARQLDDPNATSSQTLTRMAKILDAISACIATEDDRDYVDERVLSREAGIDELAPLIQATLAGPGKPAKAEPKRRVRRR